MRDAEMPVRFRVLAVRLREAGGNSPSPADAFALDGDVGGQIAYVLPGTRLLEAASIAGLPLDLPCGGEGVCGKCRVRVREGAQPPTAAEVKSFTPEELADGYRLACQSTVEGPTRVEVPETTLLATCHKILAHAEKAEPAALDPAVRKRYVECPPPRRHDDAPDLVRLQRVLGAFQVPLELLRELPARLRNHEFRGTAVQLDGTLIDFEPGNSESRAYAVAVDVGTTTLVAAMMDLQSGKALDVVARLNPQTSIGDDVLARILHCRQPDGLEQLQRAVIDAIDEMIGQLCGQSGVAREEIYEVTLSGNTTMQQLLCRIDPQPLGEVPFVPAGGGSLWLPAAELGLEIHPRGRALVMPVIGGFVGGDTVSGILATSLGDAASPALLVDIGTNGEIVLAAHGALSAASTAAGPAFEGARIAHGMRGSLGAIEKVVVDGHLRINVIGNVAPRGICGSGLIDLAAELLRHGIITSEGRLLDRDQIPATVPDDLAQRLIPHQQRPAFVVASADETGTGRAVFLTQRDVRELQLASGAIRAGITILLQRAGLKPADLDGVLMAGGFGNFIRRKNAQRIGLLPTSVPRHRIRYQGNTSLAGAQLVALSQKARRLADDLARRTEHVDLSCYSEFQTIFADSMIFPEHEAEG